ncbi:MAG: helix-turn-helix transcriptional regulator [Oscillospiraceae bacterium]|nr:helix-turn-helix transcriptional regulator [Oscillospiraceae bacterium]
MSENRIERTDIGVQVQRYDSRSTGMKLCSVPELILVYSGTVHVKTPTEHLTLTQGQAALINADVPRSLICSEDALCMGLAFSPEVIAAEKSVIYIRYIQPVLGSTALSAVKFSDSVLWERRVAELGAAAAALVMRHTGEPQLTAEEEELALKTESSCCFELELHCHLAELWRLVYINLVAAAAGAETENVYRKRVNLMVDFIRRNYRRSVSLEDIAASANISKSEASRCFRRCLKTAPVTYLLRYRVDMAAELLRNSSLTMDEISFECGFGTSAYFCKMFQQYMGITPGRYRRNIRNIKTGGQGT